MPQSPTQAGFKLPRCAEIFTEEIKVKINSWEDNLFTFFDYNKVLLHNVVQVSISYYETYGF